MTKKELVSRMQQCVGDKTGMISLTQFAAFMGIHPNNAGKYLSGLEYVGGRRKKYFLDDVAEALMEGREIR